MGDGGNLNPLPVEAHGAKAGADQQGNALAYLGLNMGTSLGMPSLSSCFLT